MLHRSYGSLDQYKLCQQPQKTSWGVRKIILCAVFLAACIYFALMVVSAAAAPIPPLDKYTYNSPFSSSSGEASSADPCLPLLSSVSMEVDLPSPVHRPSAIIPSKSSKAGGSKKAARAVMVLGLVLGKRYALKPEVYPDLKTASATGKVQKPPKPVRKPQRSSALSVAAYRQCKAEHLLQNANAGHSLVRTGQGGMTTH